MTLLKKLRNLPVKSDKRLEAFREVGVEDPVEYG
jgi:hypothetical protein